MNYYFQDFHFKSDELVLLKQDELVNLRANEAKLLALLISAPNKVFNKKEIMESVWAGKMVSEQSIFQNISHLRAIFGESAIKTHPKKGYQWCIPLKQETDTSLSSRHESEKQSSHTSMTKPIALFALCSLIVLSVALVGVRFNGESSHQEPSASVPILTFMIGNALQSHSTQNTIAVNIKKKFVIETVEASSPLDIERMISAPELISHTFLSQYAQPLLITNPITEWRDGVSLTFAIVSHKNAWQSTLFGVNKEDLANKVVASVNRVLESGYLTINRHNYLQVNANLRLLYNRFPDDPAITGRLIEGLIKTGNLTEAKLIATRALKHLRDKEKDVGWHI